ncbi:MAG: HlyD family efflux transporter periplasmic adaptor subunit [Saprospiraceae bacterium]
MPDQHTQFFPPDTGIGLFKHPPGWMLRWGIGMVAVTFAVLLVASAFIQYPQTTRIAVTLDSSAPYLQIVSPQDGVFSKWLVASATEVVAGMPLALLRSSTDWQEIQDLKQLLLSPPDEWRLKDTSLPTFSHLGEVAPLYVNLRNAHERYQWLRDQRNAPLLAPLATQMQQTRQIAADLQQQQELQQEELQIANRNAEQYRALLSKGTASQLEADAAYSRLIAAVQKNKDLQIAVTQNERSAGMLQERISGILQETRQETLAAEQQVRIWVSELQKAIQVWEEQYVIKAPADGQVQFDFQITPGQLLTSRQPLASLIPTQGERIYTAQGWINGADYGPIQYNDSALVRVHAFPFREYGQLSARVVYLGLTPSPQSNAYPVVLAFTQDLVTTTGDTIPFRQQLPAEALIIGPEKSLLRRLVNQLFTEKKQ